MLETEIIEDELLSLGITPNMLGFHLICKAVKIISADPTVRVSDVYRALSLEFAMNESAIERNIRHAISSIRDSVRKERLCESKKNAAVLYTLELKLRRKLKNE